MGAVSEATCYSKPPTKLRGDVMAKKTSVSTKRTRTVVRNASTGRFTKSLTAEAGACSEVTVAEVSRPTSTVEVARSARTGRFVKKSTARRHPKTTKVETLER